jgi:hypothetical protein
MNGREGEGSILKPISRCMTVLIGTDDKYSGVSYCGRGCRGYHSKINLGKPDLRVAVRKIKPITAKL